MKHFEFKRGVDDLRRLDIEPARYLNLGFASWLLLSAFLWHHSELQFMATIFLGAVIAIAAPFEVGSTRVRQTNLAAGFALFLTAVVLPGTSAWTALHNGLLGLFVLGTAFFGPPHGTMRVQPPAPDDAYEATGGV